MKAYLVNEIAPEAMERLKAHLEETFIASRLEQIYWAPLPDGLLTETQARHTGCKPHVFAVEVGTDWVKFEFLVRSLNTMHCTCPGYCTDAQREYVVGLADGILERLNIRF